MLRRLRTNSRYVSVPQQIRSIKGGKHPGEYFAQVHTQVLNTHTHKSHFW